MIMSYGKRVAVLSSTSGSVLRGVYDSSAVESFSVDLVISDRSCGAVQFAEEMNIDSAKIDWKDNMRGSMELMGLLLSKRIDFLYLFFSRMLVGPILDNFAGRIVNFHPSILPSFPGLGSFERAIGAGVKVLGSTTHYIDRGIDTGPVLMRTRFLNNSPDIRLMRHKLYSQQCASLYQVHRNINGFKRVVKSNVSREFGDFFWPPLDTESESLYRKILTI